MKSISPLKLFISYSHKDEELVNRFISHLAPLKDNGLIKEWYDRKLVAGEEFNDTIDNNLENAEIICLMISASFLDSDSCKKEKRKAFELNTKKNIPVLPIILSHCGWKDDQELSKKLALPTDGKPLKDYYNYDEGCNVVYEKLKEIINKEITIRALKFKDDFLKFIESTDLLSKAHSHKEKVTLNDIFIYPDLIKYDEFQEYEKKISSEQVIKNFYSYFKVMIAGDDQSGKTTLCKKFILSLREQNFIPIYLPLNNYAFKKASTKLLIESISKQYESDSSIFEDYDIKKRIILILDDFHLLKNKEEFLEQINEFDKIIVIVDNIFTLNFINETIIKSFNLFKVLELSPLLRYELIKKWISLNDLINESHNNYYKEIDNKSELVDQTLGKILSSGIMPAYPFYLLSIISTYETFQKPLNQEITSQGYCYQALVYLYLRKQKVKDDEIDIYINFLTELSFYFMQVKKREISQLEFDEFIKSYSEKFNLPIDQNKVVNILSSAKIFGQNNFNNYSFYYKYLYFYFVAKYLAENYHKCSDIISNLIQNLHKNENAYIIIFIAHHTKNINILDEITLNAMLLFEKYPVSNLNKEELEFFDEKIEILIKEILPSFSQSPEKTRTEKLKEKGKIEEAMSAEEEDKEISSEIGMELRRGIQTVEVMGRILKNRAGSLEKGKLVEIFYEAMKVHLRILNSFIEIIKDENEEKNIIELIQRRINFINDKIIKEGGKKPTKEKIEKIARIIFWNMNFEVVFSIILRIIHSIGSDKLLNIVTEVCDKEKTPAAFLVKHGILMWYNKNLQLDSIIKWINDKQNSDISKKILRRLIVRHASMHLLDYKDRQKIESKLGIPSDRLLIEHIKND